MDQCNLIKKFIKGNTKKSSIYSGEKFLVVGLIGLTGVGKTTLSYLLSKETKLPIYSHDQVRRFLAAQGKSHKDRDLIEKLNYERELYCIKHRISHIIDGDILRYFQDLGHVIDSYDGQFLLINIICPGNLVEQRLIKRSKQKKANKYASDADWGVYLKTINLHLQMPYPEQFFFTFDSSKETKPQIDKLVFKIRRLMV